MSVSGNFSPSALPEMIIFDYGQTLVDEVAFSGIDGTAELLRYAKKNPLGLDAAAVQAKADEFNRLIGSFDRSRRHLLITEVHNHCFQNILYESLGIELSLTPDEREDIFWRAATPQAKPCEGISELLGLLHRRGIRTGVISNISYSGRALKKRINELLPENRFEFFIASSDYVFRKPNSPLFELALYKSGLTADRVWYCGDNPKCDIVGAHSVGMTGLLYTGACEPRPDSMGAELVISDWRELYELIEKIK